MKGHFPVCRNKPGNQLVRYFRFYAYSTEYDLARYYPANDRSDQIRLYIGIVVSMSYCHPRGPGFDSWLYPRNFSGIIGSGTGSTQPREDNISSEIWLRKLKLRLRDKCFANHKALCTAIW